MMMIYLTLSAGWMLAVRPSAEATAWAQCEKNQLLIQAPTRVDNYVPKFIAVGSRQSYYANNQQLTFSATLQFHYHHCHYILAEGGSVSHGPLRLSACVDDVYNLPKRHQVLRLVCSHSARCARGVMRWVANDAERPNKTQDSGPRAYFVISETPVESFSRCLNLVRLLPEPKRNDYRHQAHQAPKYVSAVVMSQFCVKIPRFSLLQQQGSPFVVNFNEVVKLPAHENPLFDARFFGHIALTRAELQPILC